MTLESYLTELDARVMSEFLDCLGLTVAEVKPICPVKQFLGQIMSDLYLKYGRSGSDGKVEYDNLGCMEMIIVLNQNYGM